MSQNNLKYFSKIAFSSLSRRSSPSLSHLSFGAEFKQISLEKISDISVVLSIKGCEKEVKGFLGEVKEFFGLKATEDVDCYGILFHGVSEKNKFGNSVEPGNIVFFPIGEELNYAELLIDLIIKKMNNNLSEGTTVNFSNVRFLDQTFVLSKLTNDSADTIYVVLGGISMDIKSVRKDRYFTVEEERNISIGLQ